MNLCKIYNNFDKDDKGYLNIDELEAMFELILDYKFVGTKYKVFKTIMSLVKHSKEENKYYLQEFL